MSIVHRRLAGIGFSEEKKKEKKTMVYVITLLLTIAATLFGQTQGEMLSQDQYITGATAQSALSNNILLDTAGTGALDTMVPGRSQYRSVHVQIAASAGISAGQIIFEYSNNPAGTFFPAQVWETTTAANVTATASVNAAFTVTASTNRMFVFKVIGRYIRCRISTGFTGGTIQAFTRLSIADYVPLINTLSTAAINAIIASGTITTVTTVSAVSQSTAAVTPVTDIASAAITSTTTSGATSVVTTGSATGFSFSLNVTAVSGTNPTLDVAVECSLNTAFWFRIYEFPRVTAVPTISLNSDTLAVPCQQIRYVRTVGGTTPSFTMSLTRVTRSVEGIQAYRYFNRTLDPNTLDSTTPGFWIGAASTVTAYIASGAATTACDVRLELSIDGTEWVAVQSPITTVANTTSLLTNSGAVGYMARLRVTNAGSGQTLKYVAIATGR